MTTFFQIRRCAIEEMPFAAHAIMSLTPVLSDKAPGIVADSDWNVYYTEESLQDKDEATRALCTETIRLLQGHAERIGRMIPPAEYGGEYYQQIACACSEAMANALLDCNSGALNILPGLQYGGFRLPSLEGYFKEVCNILGPPPEMPQGQPSSGGEGGSSGNQPQQTPPQKQIRKPRDPSKTGSAADGKKRDWETQKADDPSDGKDQQELPQQPQNAHVAPKKYNPFTQSAVNQSIQSIGSAQRSRDLFSVMSEKETDQERPRRNLVSLIRQFSETNAGYTYRKCDGRNRRQGQIASYNNMQMCLPRDVGPKVDLMIVLDTSGSMYEDVARAAMIYIAELMESLNMSSTSAFYTGDVQPQYQGNLTTAMARDMYMDGDGGTDMSAVCKRAYRKEVARGGHPNILVCVTDGETDWDEYDIKQIDIPMIIAVVGKTEEYIEEVLSYYPVPDSVHVSVVADNCISHD